MRMMVEENVSPVLVLQNSVHHHHHHLPPSLLPPSPPPPPTSSLSLSSFASSEGANCPVCGVHFSGKYHKYNLKRHLDIHRGVRPFPCQHCGHQFNRRHNLDRHMERVHSVGTAEEGQQQPPQSPGEARDGVRVGERPQTLPLNTVTLPAEMTFHSK